MENWTPERQDGSGGVSRRDFLKFCGMLPFSVVAPDLSELLNGGNNPNEVYVLPTGTGMRLVAEVNALDGSVSITLGNVQGGVTENGEPKTLIRVMESITDSNGGDVLTPRRVGSGSRKIARGGKVETTYFSLGEPIKVIPEMLVKVPEENVHYGEQLAYAQEVLDEVFAGEESFTSGTGTRGYYGYPEVAINRDAATGAPKEMLMRIKNKEGTKALPKGFRLTALQLRDDPAVRYPGAGARSRNDVLYVPAPPPEIVKEAIFIPGLEVEPVTGEEFDEYRDFMLKLFYEFNQEQIDPNWGVSDFESFKKMYEESGGMIPARPDVRLGWFEVSGNPFNKVLLYEINYRNLPMDKPLAVGHPVFVITDGTEGGQPGVEDLMYPRTSGPVVYEDERSVTVGAPVIEWGTERVLQVMVAWNDTRYNVNMNPYREGDVALIAEQADKRGRELLLYFYAVLFPREVSRIKEMWKSPKDARMWVDGPIATPNSYGHITWESNVGVLLTGWMRSDGLEIATSKLGIPASFRRVAGEEEM